MDENPFSHMLSLLHADENGHDGDDDDDRGNSSDHDEDNEYRQSVSPLQKQTVEYAIRANIICYLRLCSLITKIKKPV